jgi:hypothetical protein
MSSTHNQSIGLSIRTTRVSVEDQISGKTQTGTILIRENTLLPEGLAIACEPFLPGWSVLKNLDRHALGRDIEGTTWNFLCLPMELRATVVGRNRASTLRRAARSLVANRAGQHFNSLEITEIVTKRFLGIPIMSVTAFSRHIKAQS